MANETVASIDFLKGGGARGPTGAARLSADASGNMTVSVDGADFAVLGGGFGANTTVQLPNNLSAQVNALNVQTSLTNNTSGSEASQWVIRLLKGGVGAPGGGFGVDTYTFAPDTFTVNSTAAAINLFSDTGARRNAGGWLGLFSNQGDVQQGDGLATLATTTQFGFMQITNCAGTPTGVPGRTDAGHTCMIYDKTANKIWFYNAAWRGVLVA